MCADGCDTHMPCCNAGHPKAAVQAAKAAQGLALLGLCANQQIGRFNGATEPRSIRVCVSSYAFLEGTLPKYVLCVCYVRMSWVVHKHGLGNKQASAGLGFHQQSVAPLKPLLAGRSY
jgi:hypothetical protein